MENTHTCKYCYHCYLGVCQKRNGTGKLLFTKVGKYEQNLRTAIRMYPSYISGVLFQVLDILGQEERAIHRI
jgi:hypothetical protein